MKMTKEQVEQARQLIWTCARTNNPSKAELRICFRELDTLCAAAREKLAWKLRQQELKRNAHHD